MNATTTRPRLSTAAVAAIAAMLTLALLAGVALASFVGGSAEESDNKPVDPSSVKVLEAGSLRDLIPADQQKQYDAYMADAGNRAEFVSAFQSGLDGTDEQEASGASSGGVQNVLAYGFDRDHVWVTASYADVAKGLITAAVAYCKTRVPAVICTAAGNWLKSLAQGYAPLNSHGVWGSLYWNRYTGGRW